MFTVLNFILKWLLPFGIASSTFLLLTAFLEDKYKKSNLDIFWKRFLHWIIAIGIIAIVISLIVHTPIYATITSRLGIMAMALHKVPVVGLIVAMFQTAHVWLSQMWNYWSLIYGRAFAFVYVIGTIVEIFALKWRISFWRAFNVIWPIVVEYPYLICTYFVYQTPIQDKVLQGILKAKLRENLNDSYENIDRGLDANGKPFEEGAGGSVQAQTRSAVNQAMKRTKVTVKTTRADNQRRAHVLVRQSRETETDRAIQQVLRGWGERVSGNSIYFPADPTYSQKEKGFIFDSAVSYSADEELGSYKAIFNDPLAPENRTSQGGAGFFTTVRNLITNSLFYLFHLTPYSIYSRRKALIDRKYFRDTTADKAKFRVQQNLDLGVIPVPKDKKGRTIDELRQLALKKAKARIPDVTTALSGFGLYGKFKSVLVGGNTAIYNFTLPPDAKLPNDFDKVQDQIGNILRIHEKPIITLSAGILSVSMPNDVNIPVYFTDMIKKRSKGASSIISGLIGEDALGRPITFELGDSTPHAIIFGKTGTGKTVLILSLLYTIMSGTDPTHLRIIYIDGKGNSFEFMRNDGSHPNPFTFAQPADASGDMDYARALIIWLEKECRRRIELFKRAEVGKISEYNAIQIKNNQPILPEILAVIDEFSEITAQDRKLKPKDAARLNVTDKFEYLAKMARSVGIRMILANQSARKELVPGKITANIPGRVSLGVTEPVEAEIALPETGIKVNLISQPGEFYSIMKGPQHPEHGNSPCLPQNVMNALNDSLTNKFGNCKYVKTRQEIFEEAGLSESDSSQTQQESSKGNVQSTANTTEKSDNFEVKNVLLSQVKLPKGPTITSSTGLQAIGSRAKQDLTAAIYIKAHESELLDHNDQLQNSKGQKRKEIRERVFAAKKDVNAKLENNHIKLVNDLKDKSPLERAVTGTNRVI